MPDVHLADSKLSSTLRVDVGCVHPECGGRGDRLVFTVGSTDVFAWRPPRGQRWVLEDGRVVWGPLASVARAAAVESRHAPVENP